MDIVIITIENIFFQLSIDVIKCIWSKIRRDEPELLGNFEEFLGRVTGEIKRSHTDLSSLESALRK